MLSSSSSSCTCAHPRSPSGRCEDIVADDGKARSQLFLASPDQPLDQAPFLRVIESGDAAAQQASSLVLALLVVVSAFSGWAGGVRWLNA